MIDDLEKTTRLLSALTAALPFEVELSEQLVGYFRAQREAIAKQRRHTICSVHYAGDEGGIVCRSVPIEGHGALVISLTHVRMPLSMNATCSRRCGISEASQ